jgi:hypothetical protein
MWSGHDPGKTLVYGHSGHLQRFLEILGPVINPR